MSAFVWGKLESIGRMKIPWVSSPESDINLYLLSKWYNNINGVWLQLNFKIILFTQNTFKSISLIFMLFVKWFINFPKQEKGGSKKACSVK